jgi:hypothetical protein
MKKYLVLLLAVLSLAFASVAAAKTGGPGQSNVGDGGSFPSCSWSNYGQYLYGYYGSTYVLFQCRPDRGGWIVVAYV